ncbi:hypothetical protein HMPREF3036_00003 [Sutterella sp. KLE1602]|nr:hypothetical protein HMPREF3036_00003 [Sutterella sp. KLE1602]
MNFFRHSFLLFRAAREVNRSKSRKSYFSKGKATKTNSFPNYYY